MLEYQIAAQVIFGGEAKAEANKSSINFDATAGRHDTLPNPAELLLTSLAACILKNAQRYSSILNFPYSKAKITVHGVRNENPPYIESITYRLEIDTDVDSRKLETWHKNILKFGTITNTLMKACEVKGEIIKIKEL